VIAVFCVLSVAAEIVVPLLLALVLKLTLQPVMRLLSGRIGLPLTVSACLVIVALFGCVAAVGLAIAVPASGWISKAPQGLVTLQDQIRLLRGPLAALQYGLQQVQHLAGPAGAVADRPTAPTAADLSGVGISLFFGTQHFVGRLFVLLLTLFFMLAAGDSMLRKLVEVVPRLRDKKHVVFITGEIERNISGYLTTITLINACVGLLAGVAMYATGIGDPLLWGTVAFLLNFIPIVGPITGIVIVFLVGLLTFGEAVPALVPAAIYLAVHIVEGQIVTPLLLARRFTLSPLTVMVSLFFWTWMWGIPGALLSVPLLAMTKIICDRIPSLAPLGHMLGAPNHRAAATED
jgi:predicted PurR-regulated permease PerM